MPPATNFVIHYGLSQTESRGDACLISVLASLTMVLHVIDFYVKNTNKIKWRQTTYRCIKRKQETMQSLQ